MQAHLGASIASGSAPASHGCVLLVSGHQPCCACKHTECGVDDDWQHNMQLFDYGVSVAFVSSSGNNLLVGGPKAKGGCMLTA